MKLCPSYIRGQNSNAELKLFNRLSQIDEFDGWIGFHSLNLSKHEYKRWGELDFVLIGPEGMIILEVKGGGVSCLDGIWKFTDRFGEEHTRDEGPFDQAKSGMYSLLGLMKEKLPPGLVARLSPGWGVVFPDISFDQVSPEMPREVICGFRDFKEKNGVRRYLQKLIKYWQEKNKKNSKQKLQKEDVKLIASYLRPSFDLVPTLSAIAEDINKEIVSLTDEQYRTIDAISEASRILCSGGAGTGKTFLALEVSRRAAFEGKKVLFTAKEPFFVKRLRSHFSEKGVEFVSRDGMDLVVQQIELDFRQPFDVLVVDEGQDLMSLADIELYDKALKNGIEAGVWRWFYDGNSQSKIFDVWEQDAYEYLKSTHAFPVKLKHNCRNTQEIVFQAQLATGAYIGSTEVRGHGLPVGYKVSNSDQESLDCLKEKLDQLFDDGIEVQEIAILSPVEFDKSIASDLPQKIKDKINVINPTSAPDVLDAKSIAFSDIKTFKGLERRFILLIDTKHLGIDEKSISLLYVAMTRANAGLWVLKEGEFDKNYNELQLKNLPKVKEQI